MSTAFAIRHLAFEHLGAIETLLATHGYDIRYVEAPTADLDAINPGANDLLVILGGPIGAYEDDIYPFLSAELRLIDRARAAGTRIIGICLGAQLIARALGARVYPGPAKEIGYAPLMLTDAGHASPLAALDGVAVLHWHGDTFDLPDGAALLASTALFPNQAFAVGDRILALQFHIETRADDIAYWLVGHAAELAGAGIDRHAIRADAARLGGALEAACATVIGEWLSGR